MVAGATLIYDFERVFGMFFKIVIIEMIFNILLTIILYPLIHKFGYSIDRTFKKNNILTRYF